MKTLIVLALLLAVCFAVRFQDCRGQTYGTCMYLFFASQGCATKWIKSALAKLLNNDEWARVATQNEWFDACAKLDRCYTYGSCTYGKKRLHCDNNFYSSIRIACKKRLDWWQPARKVCLDLARTVRQTLISFAEPFFKQDNQCSVCRY